MQKTRRLTRISMIAGLYAAVTFAVFFLSFGVLQLRVSEALTVLAAFSAEAIPGLSLGCAAANLFGFLLGINPAGWLDAIFGTLATALAALCSYQAGKCRRMWVKAVLVPLFPVVFNALIVGAELTMLMGPFSMRIYMVNAGLVGASEALVCYLLGVPLMLALSKETLREKLFGSSCNSR